MRRWKRGRRGRVRLGPRPKAPACRTGRTRARVAASTAPRAGPSPGPSIVAASAITAPTFAGTFVSTLTPPSVAILSFSFFHLLTEIARPAVIGIRMQNFSRLPVPDNRLAQFVNVDVDVLISGGRAGIVNPVCLLEELFHCIHQFSVCRTCMKLQCFDSIWANGNR